MKSITSWWCYSKYYERNTPIEKYQYKHVELVIDANKPLYSKTEKSKGGSKDYSTTSQTGTTNSSDEGDRTTKSR